MLVELICVAETNALLLFLTEFFALFLEFMDLASVLFY